MNSLSSFCQYKNHKSSLTLHNGPLKKMLWSKEFDENESVIDLLAIQNKYTEYQLFPHNSTLFVSAVLTVTLMCLKKKKNLDFILHAN